MAERKVTEEHLDQTWSVLVETADRRGVITYGELKNRVGIPMANQGVGALLLDPLWEEYCRPRGWPDLSALVVRKDTGRPAERALQSLGGEPGWEAERRRVNGFSWPSHLPAAIPT